MKKHFSIIIALIIIGFNACKEENFELGDPPTSSDATFSFNTSATSDNILTFRADNPSVLAVWDFGNGSTAKGTVVTATYPRKGTYTVSLTVFTEGGSASSKKDIVILNDDFTLLNDPLFTYLSGGIDSTNGKTWVIDSANAAHFGVGPNPIGAAGNFPEYYDAGPNEKAGAGLYNDRYTFKINGFGFDMYTQGEVYINMKQQNDFPGAYDSGVGDLTAPFPDQLGESWILNFEAGSDTTLTVSGNSFLGYNTGVSTYKVITLTENELFLSYEDDNDPALLWYIRLIPAGYVPTGGGGGGGGGGNTGASLPIDFESNPPTFESFGGSTATVIDNPDPRGNSSSKVLETVHGSEPWAGVAIELENKLDFSTDSFIVVKVWSSSPGRVLRIKIEDKNDPTNSVEADINIVTSLSWVERRINFGRIATSGTYDKIALFPGWDVPDAGTFYLDDIRQE